MIGIFVSTNSQSGLLSFGCFRLSLRLKCTTSSPILRVNSPFFESINVAYVAKKGLPNSSGTCLSSSIFITTKSTGKKNFPTLISTSSRIPSGWANVLSAIYRVMAMGVSSPKLSLLSTDRGIKLMLAPESHKAFPMSAFPIMQGIVKLPRSYLFFLVWTFELLHYKLHLGSLSLPQKTFSFCSTDLS